MAWMVQATCKHFLKLKTKQTTKQQQQKNYNKAWFIQI